MNSRAIIVAGMRCQGQLPRHVVHLLTQARHCCGQLILTVTAGNHVVRQQAEHLGVRVGFVDPGSTAHVFYCAGIGLLGTDHGLANIVLCDDSIVALNPAQLLSQTPSDAPDLALAALTMTRAPLPCAHAYWLSFMGRASIESAAFRQWWLQSANTSDAAMTRHFLAAGYQVGALFNQDRSEQVVALCRAYACGALQLPIPPSNALYLDPTAAHYLDPTIFGWDRLMAEHGVVSLRLVNENPHGVNIVKLRKWIAQTPGVSELFAHGPSPR